MVSGVRAVMFIGVFTARYGWTGFLWTRPAVLTFLVLALVVGTFNRQIDGAMPARQESRV